MLPRVEIDGRLTADPELRFTPGGKAVVNLRVAASDRRKNPNTGAWEDGDSCFLTVNAWDQLAENVAESLTKGSGVLVVGRLRQREYENREHQKVTVFEVQADAIGPSLRWASAKVTQAQRLTAPTGQAPWAKGPPEDQGPAWQDPWGTAAGGWGLPTQDDNPPF